MAEQQSAHRRDLERFVVLSDASRANWGLVAGFVVSLSVLAASCWLIVSGHEVSGTIFGTLDLAALVGVFVYGTNVRKKERIAKAELMAGRSLQRGLPSPQEESSEK